MMYLTPLPPGLYEVINCALFASATVVLILCLRYLMTAYVQMRKAAADLPEPALSRFEAFYELRKLRLAVGLTVFLLGESPRMGYLWLARYLANTGHDITWLSKGFWIAVPVLGSGTAVVGLACIARAIVPGVWGRFGYAGTLLIAVGAIIATQIIRDPEELAYVSIIVAVVLSLSSTVLRGMRRLRDA